MPPITLEAPPVAAQEGVTRRVLLPRVLVATSYNEQSILNLARAAADVDLLDTLFTPELPAPILRYLLATPLLRETRAGQVVQRRAAGLAHLPATAVRSRLFMGQMARVGIWVTGYRNPALDGAVTALFDRAVRRDLLRRPRQRAASGVLVGMHCSSLQSFLAARTRGILTVYNHVNCNLHDLNARVRAAGERLGIQPRGLWPDWLIRRVDREVAVADYIFTSSTHLRDDLIGRGVASAKIHVIPDGVDAARFAPPDAATAAPPLPGGLRVIFVGVVSLGKGLQDLDAAVAGCGEGVVASCEAIGGIIDPELVARTPHIRYRGMMHHEEVARALREADVFVLPSLGDTMPRVVMEAMAAGLPVITTREAGCDHIIQHGENGYIVPAGDPAALAAILRALAAAPATRRAIGRAARRTVEAYPWSRHGEDFRTWLATLPLPSPVGQAGLARTRR